MIDFWVRFDQLVQERGLTNKEVYSQAKIAPNTFSDWRNKNRVPKADKAQALARILGTTAEYLTTGQSTLPMASSNHLPIIHAQIDPSEHWEQPHNIAGYLDIFKLNDKAIKQYAMLASGSSMLGVGIAEGDYVIFTPHSAKSPLQDGLYVFAIEKEVYCKRLEFDSLANTIKIFNMRSTDPKEAELIRTVQLHSDSEKNNLTIIGKVTGFYHAYM